MIRHFRREPAFGLSGWRIADRVAFFADSIKGTGLIHPGEAPAATVGMCDDQVAAMAAGGRKVPRDPLGTSGCSGADQKKNNET